MARIILFVVGAVVVFVLAWMLFSGLVHLLVLGFWVVLIALIGMTVLRVTRWSKSR